MQTHTTDSLKIGGLESPEAFVDCPEQYLTVGFTGFKIHGCNDGNVNREKENLRGVRNLVGGGCVMVHADPEYDLGITDVLKIAHFCEALGLGLQLHACEPTQRAALSTLRNSRFTKWR